ncbi:hypothetical protein IGI04_003458 [Brassica rapa subsp. trilocularis]|uniref:RRM domain-containing protein n=1 Tax=Brassica rapa subsp. trilocularis TaxID=1813537 RepID=A0ABQ7NYF0_BRACM|nr:hypothetical protein IGI04_003458 [Brassica rapa subsp. trilocularis]
MTTTLPPTPRRDQSFSSELKLFVGNLPFNVDSAQVAQLFESAGNVEVVEQPGCLEITHHGQVFMLRRAPDEPRGHAAAIMNEGLLDAECKGVINACQKKELLQQMALHLS